MTPSAMPTGDVVERLARQAHYWATQDDHDGRYRLVAGELVPGQPSRSSPGGRRSTTTRSTTYLLRPTMRPNSLPPSRPGARSQTCERWPISWSPVSDQVRREHRGELEQEPRRDRTHTRPLRRRPVSDTAGKATDR